MTQKIQEIEENVKVNNMQDLYNGVIRNEREDLQTDPTKIIDVWKRYFDKLLNVHNGEQTKEFEIYTTEPWIPEPSEIEVEMSIKKFKKFK